MGNCETNQLITRILNLVKDYDIYEFRDNYDNDDDAYDDIKNMIVNNNVTDIIVFCDNVLESDDEECYQEAEEIKELLMKF